MFRILLLLYTRATVHWARKPHNPTHSLVRHETNFRYCWGVIKSGCLLTAASSGQCLPQLTAYVCITWISLLKFVWRDTIYTSVRRLFVTIKMFLPWCQCIEKSVNIFPTVIFQSNFYFWHNDFSKGHVLLSIRSSIQQQAVSSVFYPNLLDICFWCSGIIVKHNL